MKKSRAFATAFFAIFLFSTAVGRAWDYEGHRLVSQLALASLSADFPAFVKTPEARERIAFLGGEPDRWRNTSDLAHANGPDHYLDLEELEAYGITAQTLTPFRYDFTAQQALARAAHPEKFKPIDPEANRDHTRQLAGFLPYAIMENYDKLKSAFSYLKTFQKDGTPEEVANAEQNATYIMGVMGHYVGDAAQPLHTTIHYNGWVGDNPQHFTREKIHARVDGFFHNLEAADSSALENRVRPAKLFPRGADLFHEIVGFIVEQHQQVVPLYQLEQSGKLFAAGENGAEGRKFLGRQLVIGGQMLGDLWYSAWANANEDPYLKNQLAQRKAAQAAGKN